MVEAVAALICPAAQSMHVLPVDGWYLPTSQSLHAADATAAYWPLAQSVHSAAFSLAEYLPAGHGRHGTVSSP